MSEHETSEQLIARLRALPDTYVYADSVDGGPATAPLQPGVTHISREDLTRLLTQAEAGAKAEENLAAVRDAAFIEDCHTECEHHPGHTPTYICRSQLSDLAKRVVRVLFGADMSSYETTQIRPKTVVEWNKLPRRLNRDRGGWYAYVAEHQPDRAAVYEQWESEGYGE